MKEIPIQYNCIKKGGGLGEGEGRKEWVLVRGKGGSGLVRGATLNG